MKDLPSWIRKILNSDNLTCGRCDKIFSRKELISVGIQKSSRKPHKEILFIGIACDICGEMTIFELQEMSLLNLAFEIIEEQTEEFTNKKKRELDNEMSNNSIRKRPGQPSNNQQQSNRQNNQQNQQNQQKIITSKITRKEIKEDVKILNNIKYHEDFLVALGMSLDDIEKYRFKKRKKRKKNEDK